MTNTLYETSEKKELMKECEKHKKLKFGRLSITFHQSISQRLKKLKWF